MMISKLGFEYYLKEPHGKLKEGFQRLQVLGIRVSNPLDDVDALFCLI
jgi:hypothetical protein